MLECSCSKCGEALRVYEEDHPQWGKSYQVDPCVTCTTMAIDLRGRRLLNIPMAEDLKKDAEVFKILWDD